jgi:transposase InsO family protein
MIAQLAATALRTAVARRQPGGVVVVHSDRGQFRARSLRAVLTAAGLQGSMGRVASAGDNAAMESWHALLQNNVMDRRRWRTRDELHSAVVHWIERTTTVADASAASASAPQSSTSSPSPVRPLSPHVQSQPPSTEPAAVPPACLEADPSAGRRLALARRQPGVT